MQPYQQLNLHPTQFRISSEPSLRQSPNTLKDMLSCSSSENLWRFMHSPGCFTPRAGELPSLDSQPSLTARLSSRPITSISNFTARENLRLEKRLGSAAISAIDSPRIAAFPLSPSLPSELDYKRAIEKLNRVAAHGGSAAHKLVLGERKMQGEVGLEEQEWLYVKVETKGKPVPLRVHIKRLKGKIVEGYWLLI